MNRGVIGVDSLSEEFPGCWWPVWEEYLYDYLIMHPLLAHWPVFWKDSTRCSAVIIFDRSSCCCLGGMKMENTGRADVEKLSAVKASCRRTGWMGGGFRERGNNNMEGASGLLFIFSNIIKLL